MKKYCGICDAFHEVTEHKETRTYQIKETPVSAEITILTCTHCNQEIYDKENESRNDILLFDDYKRKHFLLTSNEIISIREKYRISQSTFSKIMGFGLKTITRYENGSIQDQTHDSFLRLASNPDNFFILWKINNHNLTESENKKIKDYFMCDIQTKTMYHYEQPCKQVYKTNIPMMGGLNYDGC